MESMMIFFPPFIQVKLTLHQRDLQIEALREEQLALLKQLTSAQETLQTQEQSLGHLQMRYDELEARLEEVQAESTSKDDTLQYLQNEKIVLEVALQVAKAGQGGLDEGVRRLGERTEAASDSLEQLRQDLSVKSSQVKKTFASSAPPLFFKVHFSINRKAYLVSGCLLVHRNGKGIMENLPETSTNGYIWGHNPNLLVFRGKKHLSTTFLECL